MRIAALVLGILGGILATALGIVWIGDYYEYKEILDRGKALGMDVPTTSLVISSYFLLTGIVAGIVGGVLTLKGKGIVGGGLMLVTVLGAAVYPKSLLFTFLLLLAAIFCFLASRGASKQPSLAA